VRLASGQEVEATKVISSADPKTSFITMVGAEHLDAGFVRQVTHLRTEGSTAKLHLALSDLPEFTGLPTVAHGARLLICPSLDYLEHAYNHSKYGEYSQSPAMEITLPSMHDATLAPRGKHVLSAVVQYAPYRLAGGWPSQRGRFIELLIDAIAQYAPGVRSMVLARELLTPEDIEGDFRATGGHWHHEDLALDQFYMVRPLPGAAQYSTPLPGFYLCGAGCHPGGGVMGLAGRNAARQVLSEAA
jgi:phytoene dehydrogenase-like protein